MGRRGRPWPRAPLSQVHVRPSLSPGVFGFALLLLLGVRSAAGERLPSAEEEEEELLQAKVHAASKFISHDYLLNKTVGQHHIGAAVATNGSRAGGAAQRRPAAGRAAAGVGVVAMTAKGSLLGVPPPTLAEEVFRTASGSDYDTFLNLLLNNATGQHNNSTAEADKDPQDPLAPNNTERLRRVEIQVEADKELRRLESQPMQHFEGLAPLVRLIFAIAGGTGASISSQASILFKADLVRRMRLQDMAVMLLMIAVYFMTLLVTANVAYHQAANNSRATYYADPRYHTTMTDGHDHEAFLEAFAQPPKSVFLNVAGLARAPEDMPGTLNYRGGSYRVDFTFALDLSAWVVRETSPAASAGSGSDCPRLPLEDGIVAEDLEALKRFLARNNNDMATVELEKEVSWPRWEELATNIKHQIRQCDYEGVIGIDRTRRESVRVYKNKQWANFMHSRTLKVVLALSVLGWAFYMPYLWFRTTTLKVRCLYQVSIGIGDYWQLIADRLCAQGFEPFDASAFGRRPPLMGLHDPDASEVFYDPEEEDSDL